MAYARFSYADVYVFMSTAGHLECCGCRLGDQWAFDSTQTMVDHLAEHRAAGHDVPVELEAQLWADDRDNWVDYRRCDVDGCGKRVTCGSPAPGGYVSACGIAHARSLGGFATASVAPGPCATCAASQRHPLDKPKSRVVIACAHTPIARSNTPGNGTPPVAA